MINPSYPIIQTHDLHFGYNHRPVLNGINLDIPAASIFGFLGPNGAGKSTTIKVILGLLQVPESMVTLFGKKIGKNRLEILSRIGAMVESPSMYDHLSAWRNLQITCRLRSLPMKRIDEVLEIVDLQSESNRPVRQFSTGMKQRLSLAIAMLGKPELLILDEPINGLDPSGIIDIRKLLSKLNQEQGCTIFLSSHILDEIEKICTHVAVINQGKLLYQGETPGLLQRYIQQERLIIHCNNARGALANLNKKDAILEGNSVAIPVSSDQESASIIKQLVTNGFEIYSASRGHSDLEYSFLELLQEGGKS
jgi:lantibiotic transport system ATP-binding protein